ncbi:acyltransferase family protein [Sphaerimonospora cavernae]|uniref:Acyltransferase family protein n=1 Tax=Sphaerimonospora cavernae TaxID=1740611 RepID=A0ABV6UCJ8_9ACTN
MTSTTGEIGRTSRLDSIVGLRFLAAFAVFLFHLSILRLFADTTLTDGFFHTFSKAGWVGVSFFFTLSGFILTWSARTEDTALRFWRRRFVKVYPNHLVTYVLALLLIAGSTGAGASVVNLFLLQSWIPDESVYFSVNNPSWSLACEIFFYILFPFLHRGLRRIRPERLWWWAGSVTTIILALPAVALALLPSTPVMMVPDKPAPAYAFWFLYILPCTRVLDFFLGMLLARILLTGLWIGIGLAPLLALLVGCYAISLWLPAVYALVAATVVPLGLVIVATAALDVRGRRTFLHHRSMRWLGEVSFAFYLVQWPVLIYGHRLLGEQRTHSTPAALGIMIAMFVISMVLAWSLYTFVERPLVKRWSVSRRRRGKKSTEPAADGTVQQASPVHAAGSRQQRSAPSPAPTVTEPERQHARHSPARPAPGGADRQLG